MDLDISKKVEYTFGDFVKDLPITTQGIFDVWISKIKNVDREILLDPREQVKVLKTMETTFWDPFDAKIITRGLEAFHELYITNAHRIAWPKRNMDRHVLNIIEMIEHFGFHKIVPRLKQEWAMVPDGIIFRSKLCKVIPLSSNYTKFKIHLENVGHEKFLSWIKISSLKFQVISTHGSILIVQPTDIYSIEKLKSITYLAFGKNKV